jgi:hypothetical protein
MKSSTILFITLTSFLYGCSIKINPNGAEEAPLYKKTLPIDSFSKLSVSGNFKVFIKQGPKQEVVLISDKEVVPFLSWEIEGPYLSLNHFPLPYLDPSLFYFLITTPDLTTIEMEGNCRIYGSGELAFQDINIEIRNNCHLDGKLNSQQIRVGLDDLAKAVLRGKTEKLWAEVEETSRLDASALVTRNARIQASGLSRVMVQVTDTLVVDAENISRVEHFGEPKYIEESLSNSARRIPKKL